MKGSFLCLAALSGGLASPLFATHLQIHALCSDALLVDKEMDPRGASVAKVTLDALTASGLTFEANESGVISIMQSPKGDAALDVLSDKEMKAYGWCYHVDGQEPGEMAGDFRLTGKEQTVIWFYGSASYKKGVWYDYCRPTYVAKPDFICRTAP